ncbi:MAG TPA: PVC-type heme-binding CxxCH protein [Planctomicrobium sp.]|nr:PVC-type heme-binding CxxCH protein [Planctomicrobium sp.]
MFMVSKGMYDVSVRSIVQSNVLRIVWVIGTFSFCIGGVFAEIPVPDDAPQPLSPAESQRLFQLPEGFRLELVVSEPLIREPSGICWDASGRLYVSELHGFNLEGHYDIQELNKTGQLDRIPRRIQADNAAKEKAKSGTYGTVKLLSDRDGDGVMDQMTVFADRLPPCHGICAARDGIIAICFTEILYLADRDGDGVAEVRETLFKGFPSNQLERTINVPVYGLDGWVYISNPGSGGRITGPGLSQPVDLPSSDFRFLPDGSAIEPILGRTRTFGATFTERGERLLGNTSLPAVAVAPIPWSALQRNPDYGGGHFESGTGDNRTYPISKPHPWRTRRAADPGFAKLYTDRYGIAETQPNGYFTSGCSPLLYLDRVLPGLHGQLLVCEPSQNMIHRSVVTRDRTAIEVHRAPEEQQKEFLATTDSWFNPIALSSGPDGCIYIVDFYREIIEDYSAIPRYLQQQYGLINGHQHGRVWRLIHDNSQLPTQVDFNTLTANQLLEQMQSDVLWRRQTAQRLLLERDDRSTVSDMERIILDGDASPSAVLIALHTLQRFDSLRPEIVRHVLASKNADLQILALQLAEPWLDGDSAIQDQVLHLASRETDPSIAFQCAISLGASRDSRVVPALAAIARRFGHTHWMDAAVLSSLSGRAGEMLQALLHDEESLGEAAVLFKPLCTSIASRRNPVEISETLATLGLNRHESSRRACWEGLAAGISSVSKIPLSPDAAAVLRSMASADNTPDAAAARMLIQRLQVETVEERTTRLNKLLEKVVDVQVPSEDRVAAVVELGHEVDSEMTAKLLSAIASSTPQVRQAILEALFSRQDRLPEVLQSLEQRQLSGALLTAVQRAALLNHPNQEFRAKAGVYFQSLEVRDQGMIAQYTAALSNERNLEQGKALFAKHCANCHKAHGTGFSVGPDLTAEAKRAEETILQDIMNPSGTISAGYSTYVILTTDGRVHTGILGSETASSITLKQPEGKNQTVLRREIEEIHARDVSLMPEDLVKLLSPQDVADLISWLRSPQTTRADALSTEN